MDLEEAKTGARDVIAAVRERGFKDGGKSFSDAQIWQALLDVKDENWGFLEDRVAVHLISQVIDGKTPAEAPQAKNL